MKIKLSSNSTTFRQEQNADLNNIIICFLLTLSFLKFLRLFGEMNASYFSHTKIGMFSFLPVWGKHLNFEKPLANGLPKERAEIVTDIRTAAKRSREYSIEIVEKFWNTYFNNRTGYWQSGLPKSRTLLENLKHMA